MITKTAAKLQYSHTVGFMSLQGGRGFANPVDLAFDSDGVMYVPSRGGNDAFDDHVSKRVTKCTVDEEYLGQFSYGGKEDGQIMWPSSIAVDSQGRAYVSDEALQRISVWDKDGQYLYKWGKQGSGEGEFDRPAGIMFDADGVAAWLRTASIIVSKDIHRKASSSPSGGAQVTATASSTCPGDWRRTTNWEHLRGGLAQRPDSESSRQTASF